MRHAIDHMGRRIALLYRFTHCALVRNPVPERPASIHRGLRASLPETVDTVGHPDPTVLGLLQTEYAGGGQSRTTHGGEYDNA